ncbi:hypothetical protein G9C98_002388 [Cotesia typhae]|uniref:Uncharacterized protein n=1 Tax=Cotesia typhae TaxID=2053667 RepID=A0A8J5UXB0_9HYME|nr:hypothetical protein G9C98_002388 [Cotesia typhae]
MSNFSFSWRRVADCLVAYSDSVEIDQQRSRRANPGKYEVVGVLRISRDRQARRMQFSRFRLVRALHQLPPRRTRASRCPKTATVSLFSAARGSEKPPL